MEKLDEFQKQAKFVEEEKNIKVSKRWLDALEQCTFHGRHAEDIAGLNQFLKVEHEAAKKRLEALIDAQKAPAPSWAKQEAAA